MKKSKVLLFALLFPFLVSAKVKLPTFFGDNMVLQQQTEAAIWGTAKAESRISIITSWNNKRYSLQADSDGKWKTKVSTPAAGGPYTITISDGEPVTLHNVMIGEVWLCSGQSNMEMPMKGFRDQPILGSNDAIFNSSNNMIRFYTVPRSIKVQVQDTAKSSVWKIAEPEATASFSATAYYFGRILQNTLKVPIGLIHISYSGSSAEAWMDADALKEFPDIKVPTLADSARSNNRTATTLYNGMLHPFVGYGIKGCIWYQGESNYDRPDQYEKLFPAMIKQWRDEFAQGDFPFYYAQIAPYNYVRAPEFRTGGKYNSAYLRDAQRKALKWIPNSGMIVTMDIGEENNIHPANKEVGGKRLAYLALAKIYDKKGFAFASPLFDTLLINGSVCTVKFRDAPNGLTSFGKTLSNFEVAGANKVFYPARAVISGGNVVVSAPEVREPVAVRYAFRDFVTGDLFNIEGFPASSFRTDDW
jgi:sialate O-acetylesterase